MLRKKYNLIDHKINEEIIFKKAIGISSAIESAIGYWDVKPTSLNAWIVSRYYALLQFTIAEQVASPLNTEDLTSVQKHTEQGHGLKLWSKNIEDPLDYKIYALKYGHLFSYVKFLKFSPDKWSFEKTIKQSSDLDLYTDKLVTIGELFSHIAELEPVLYSYVERCSYCLHIGSAQRNLGRTLGVPNELKPNFSFLNIFVNPDNPIDMNIIKDSDIPLKNIEIDHECVPKSEREIYIGKLDHDQNEYWHSTIKTYKSDFTGTMYIKPLFQEVYDPIIRHFFILYGLSIIVRYMPNVWHEIKSGKYGNIGALIEYYLTIVEDIIPLLMLERISGNKVRTAQPGSMFSLR
jgi:hypothetical protein